MALAIKPLEITSLQVCPHMAIIENQVSYLQRHVCYSHRPTFSRHVATPDAHMHTQSIIAHRELVQIILTAQSFKVCVCTIIVI